jgi:hypothetical protein
VVLTPDVLDKHYYGRDLDEREAREIDRIPLAAAELLASIPRMEGGSIDSVHRSDGVRSCSSASSSRLQLAPEKMSS